jgi:hypothetical protein
VQFEELGPVEGSACRHFILAVIHSVIQPSPKP